MSVEERASAAERVLSARERYVARGVATPPLANAGAGEIETAGKMARAASGRAGVVAFDRAFHGRTSLTMAMTAKLVYEQGFGPLATDVYRVAAPYPFRSVSTEDALANLELL